MFLPFKGLELGVIAIGILGASIVYLSKKIITTTCVIPVQKKLKE